MRRTGKPFILTAPIQPETCARYCCGLLLTDREVTLLKAKAQEYQVSVESIVLSFIREKLDPIVKE